MHRPAVRISFSTPRGVPRRPVRCHVIRTWRTSCCRSAPWMSPEPDLVCGTRWWSRLFLSAHRRRVTPRPRDLGRRGSTTRLPRSVLPRTFRRPNASTWTLDCNRRSLRISTTKLLRRLIAVVRTIWYLIIIIIAPLTIYHWIQILKNTVGKFRVPA